VAQNESSPPRRGTWWVWLVVVVLVVALGGGLIWYSRGRQGAAPEKAEAQKENATVATEAPPPPPTTGRVVELPVESKEPAAQALSEKEGPKAAVDLSREAAGQPPRTGADRAPGADLPKAAEEREMAAEQARRKKALGLEDSVEAVVKEGETIKIGRTEIKMDVIAAQIRSKQRELREETIAAGRPPARGPAGAPAGIQGQVSPERDLKAGLEPEVKERDKVAIEGTRIRMEDMIARPRSKARELKQEGIGQERPEGGEKVNLYGIRLVRPGDNLWNIHFQVLKEYFAHRGVEVSSDADEPGPRGVSSGVGRILKFAERMVHIFNLTTGELSEDLDMIQPHQKIIVFNMTQLDESLRDLDWTKIKKLRFDGTSLYVEE